VFVDPFGHRWMIQTTIASPTAEEISAAMDGFEVVTAPTDDDRSPAEIGYVTFHVDDAERATRFYAELFGWSLAPGRAGPGYRHVANTRLPIGFTPHGVDERPTILVRVTDVDAAAARVVELGGQVVERSESDAGPMVACRDDQGLRVDLWQPAPGH
jgi:predicted enzyme related to lactoylglutathione lyase